MAFSKFGRRSHPNHKLRVLKLGRTSLNNLEGGAVVEWTTICSKKPKILPM